MPRPNSCCRQLHSSVYSARRRASADVPDGVCAASREGDNASHEQMRRRRVNVLDMRADYHTPDEAFYSALIATIGWTVVARRAAGRPANSATVIAIAEAPP